MTEQTVDDLFTAALAGDRENDAAWKAVTELHRHGSREILERATALTESKDSCYCARGADILGQLGCLSAEKSQASIPERLNALLKLLERASDPIILDAAIVALGHMAEPEGLRAILRFAEHPNEDVRWAVAWALPRGLSEPQVIETLMLLMRDSDPDVRDWATFGLGTQSDADSPAIRDALLDRLQDEDEDARAEAVVGLAKRQDLRALPIVLEVLQRDEYGTLYEEAASYLLGLDTAKPEGWESWRYVEELRARFSIVAPSSERAVQ